MNSRKEFFESVVDKLRRRGISLSAFIQAFDMVLELKAAGIAQEDAYRIAYDAFLRDERQAGGAGA